MSETTIDLALEEEISAVLDQPFDEIDFRANVPAGTELGRQTGPGGEQYRFKKANSMVNMDGEPLAERMLAYRLDNGAEAWLPTVQVRYFLRKRDEFGKRVFELAKPIRDPETRQIIGYQPPSFDRPEPIAETCEICKARRRGRQKNFYDKFQLRTHYMRLHPDEWQLIQEERADARTVNLDPKQIAAALLSLPVEVRQQLMGIMNEEPEKRGPGRPRANG